MTHRPSLSINVERVPDHRGWRALDGALTVSRARWLSHRINR